MPPPDRARAAASLSNPELLVSLTHTGAPFSAYCTATRSLFHFQNRTLAENPKASPWKFGPSVHLFIFLSLRMRDCRYLAGVSPSERRNSLKYFFYSRTHHRLQIPRLHSSSSPPLSPLAQLAREHRPGETAGSELCFTEKPKLKAVAGEINLETARLPLLAF